jgi:cytochrome c biogenesis protein CcdA
MSLIGALTPLGKAAPKYWIWSASAYTAAGSMSALVTGAVLGFTGHLLGVVVQACSLIIPFALVLAAREFGWLRFELPGPKRQTEKVWAHEFGFITASAMWGFHIGLGFATYISYGGFLILAAIAFAMGDATYGAILMLTYWLGRATSVWVMPLVWQTPQLDDILNAILSTRTIYSRSDGFALIWSAGILSIWVLKIGGPIFIGHLP